MNSNTNPLKTNFQNSNQFKKKRDPTILNSNSDSENKNNEYRCSLNYLNLTSSTDNNKNESFFKKKSSIENDDNLKDYIKNIINNEINFQVNKKLNEFKTEIGEYLHDIISNNTEKDETKLNMIKENFCNRFLEYEDKIKKIDESINLNKNNSISKDTNKNNEIDESKLDDNSFNKIVLGQTKIEETLLNMKKKMKNLKNDIVLIKNNEVSLKKNLEKQDKLFESMANNSFNTKDNISLLEEQNKNYDLIKNKLELNTEKIITIEKNMFKNKNNDYNENNNFYINNKIWNKKESYGVGDDDFSFVRETINFKTGMEPFDKEVSVIKDSPENETSQFIDNDIKNFMTNNSKSSNKVVNLIKQGNINKDIGDAFKKDIKLKTIEDIPKENNKDIDELENIYNIDTNSLSKRDSKFKFDKEEIKKITNDFECKNNENNKENEEKEEKKINEANFDDFRNSTNQRLNTSIKYDKDVFKKAGHSFNNEESVLDLFMDDENYLINAKGERILDDLGNEMKLNEEDIENFKENGLYEEE